MVDSLPMSRSLALVAIVSLLLNPLGIWTGAGCCEVPDCCKNGLCPMRPHAQPAKASSQDGEAETECHRSQAAPQRAPAPNDTRCKASAQCARLPQQAHMVPHTRGVLPHASPFVFPEGARAGLAVANVRAAAGYSSPPLHPPRSVA